MKYLAAGNGGGGGATIWIMMALLIGAMYFLMIRPQQKRRRAIEEMQSKMGPGDEVVTVGGLYGIVESVDDDMVLLEISPGVTARYARASISRVVTPAASVDDEESDEIDDDADGDAEPETAAEGTASGRKVADPD